MSSSRCWRSDSIIVFICRWWKLLARVRVRECLTGDRSLLGDIHRRYCVLLSSRYRNDCLLIVARGTFFHLVHRYRHWITIFSFSSSSLVLLPVHVALPMVVMWWTSVLLSWKLWQSNSRQNGTRSIVRSYMHRRCAMWEKLAVDPNIFPNIRSDRAHEWLTANNYSDCSRRRSMYAWIVRFLSLSISFAR